MSSCCSTPAPKEKKWGIKDCRARKCPELQRDPKYADSQERCRVFNSMPGTMSHCIRDPETPPEEFLHHSLWSLVKEEEIAIRNRKTPGPKNCPRTCPYKISGQGEVFKKATDWKKVPGTIWKCAFTGAELGHGLSGMCSCHVLDNPDSEKQIETLRQTIFHRWGSSFDRAACNVIGCPDGINRCKAGDIVCPVIKLPFIEIKECPLWRIPAKLLPKPAIAAAEDPGKTPEKPEKPVEEKQAASKKKKKEPARSIEDRIDDLEQQTGMYLWADITQCCVLIQEIKCLFRRIRKSQVKVIPRKAAPRIEPNQSDLFSFGKEEPAATLKDPICYCTPCKTWATCTAKPESEECKTLRKTAEDLKKEPKKALKIGVDIQECETTCGNCGHHKGRKSFAESCPRVSDLMFKGGKYSAHQLMEETTRDGCNHKIPKIQETKKKTSEKPYTIYIRRSDGKHPFIVSCNSRKFGGTSNPCDIREEVIKRALTTLDGFVHDVKKSSPTLAKKSLPVTIETTLFIDKTGLFKITDFFDDKGEPQKPVVEPKKSASKKSKKKEEPES